jgi:tRNA-2-methylthio-N6-dimethylallyladenosine synthase
MSTGKYQVVTYGCQMNKADSERIAALLESIGLGATDDEREADVIVVNTCSVRQAAEDRVFGKLRDFERLREGANPGLVVVITGCLPGRDKDGKIRAKMPAADLYFPIRELPELPRRLAGLRPDLVKASEGVSLDYLAIAPKRGGGHHAFVTVQTGCDKYCTYCVVPYARGREANRPVAEIMDEVRGAMDGGAVSVTLLGQAVNAYVAPDPGSFSAANPYRDSFAALLWEIDKLPGLQRLWYTSAHPQHMTDEVIDALALPRFMNFLHLPVQAGSDEVLRRMNRRCKVADYLAVIGKIKARVPAMALGSDLIVGFPGETAEQFAATLALYRACDFDISYNAMYSARSGTTAAKFFPDDVPRAEKKARWHELQAVMEEVVLRKNQAYLGSEVEVLVDDCARGWCSGQSREMKLTRFRSGEGLVGQTVRVKVTKAMTWMLEGEGVRR